MPTSNSTRRAALAAAAIVGGVMVAMIVEIVLARRGILLVSIWQGLHRGGGTPLRAAIAWWAIAGGAFPAGFVLAFVPSRVSWLYFRALRFVASAALILILARVGNLALPAAAGGGAGHQALASLAALAAAMLMAGFGAFFALRH
jgi:hypothetical protein